jgi:CIC family chloride channel protein
MSLGREGPTVQIGASIGKLVGDVLKIPKRSYGALIASGAGAGLAAAFNAPLAGFLFVMEELKREMSPITYGTALLGSVCSVAVTRYLLGQSPSFQLVSPEVPPLIALFPILLLGGIAGLIGIAFNRGLLGVLVVRDKLKCPKWLAGLIVGVVSGLLLIYFPAVTGGGHHLIAELLRGHLEAKDVLLFALAVVVVKLAFTALCYGTGVPGGIFAPMLAIGAFLGYAYGFLVHQISPGLNFTVEGFATIGMAAVFAGSVRAPLTGVVLIVEMTAEYKLLYALLVGSFAAYALAELLGDEPIYEALLERDIHAQTSHQADGDLPEVIEFIIEPDSEMDGRKIKDLEVPEGALITGVIRQDRNLVPRGSTQLLAGDAVTLVLDGDNLSTSIRIHDMAKAPS